MHRIFVIFILTLVSFEVPAYFKCTGQQGEVSFQEYPCPDATDQVEERIRGEHKSQSSDSGNSPRQINATANQKYTEEYVGDPPESLVEIATTLGEVNAAVASLSALKMILTQYFAMNGKWPERLSDAGFEDGSMNSSKIDSVRLEAGGVIVAKLNDDIGIEKYIAMQPQTVLGGTNIEWLCFANFSKQVLNHGDNNSCKSRVIK